jgi:hypothetical protein
MPPPQSRALLFRLLQNDPPSPNEIQGLVQAFKAQRDLEGQWFDAKSGLLLQNKQGDELRAATAGFANAEGGFLLIGYNEGAQAFDHVADVGKQKPEQWVTDALGSIAHVIPPPRFATVDVGGGPVLLVAIERARQLVYVIEKGEPIYYLRFGHQTKPMPPGLIADLTLGRRAQPELIATLVRASVTKARQEPTDTGIWATEIRIDISIENNALVVARDAVAGLVAWSAQARAPLPSTLIRAVDLQPPTANYGALEYFPHHVSTSIGRPTLGPFRVSSVGLTGWSLPAIPSRFLEATAALYLLAADSEPAWFQITLHSDSHLHGLHADWLTKHRIRLVPCFYSRPVVSVRFLAEGEPVEFPQ